MNKKYETEHECQDSRLAHYVIGLNGVGHVAGPLLSQKRDELRKAEPEERVERLLEYAEKIGMRSHVDEYLAKLEEIEAVLPHTPIRRWIPVPPPQPVEAEEEAVRLLRDDLATTPLEKYVLGLQLDNGRSSS